jgi:regulator of cell morphogenesis and NO signaling
MLVQEEEKIGDVVAKNFRAAQVFEKFGLDFCCGGKKPIKQACEDKGINSEELINELNSLAEQDVHPEENYAAMPLDSLIDQIISRHHSYVVKNLPVIYSRIRKVAEVHGKNHTETLKIAELFTQVKEDLETHLQKEEKMLFPYIKYMVSSQRNGNAIHYPPFGTVANPVNVMEAEHESAGKVLEEIRKLSNGFNPPEDACETFKILYKELEEFEQDLHKHIHLENNILHPRAIELERILQNNN